MKLKNLKNLFSKNKPIIYTSSDCGYCAEVKKTLEEENVEFDEKLITEYKEDWMKIVELTSLPVTPCVHYKNKYFLPVRDFPNPSTLVKILENYDGSLANDKQELTFEHVKTLGHHVNMAFQRLDQRLKAIEESLPKTKKKNEKKGNTKKA